MEKNKQSFFRKSKNSIIRPSELTNMAKEGVGSAIKYLLLLTLTLGVLSGTIFSFKAYLNFSTMIEKVKTDVPDFSLENGILAVEGDEPIILGNLEKEIIIIDDTGVYNRENIDSYPDEGKDIILITNEYIINEDGIKKTEVNFADFGNFRMDKEMLLNFKPYLIGVIVIIGMGIPIWFFVSKLAMGLLYALLGMIVARVKKKSTSYGELYSLGLYAITFPSMLAILLIALNAHLPWIIYAGIVVSYYVFAFRTVPSELPNSEGPPIDIEGESKY